MSHLDVCESKTKLQDVDLVVYIYTLSTFPLELQILYYTLSMDLTFLILHTLLFI